MFKTDFAVRFADVDNAGIFYYPRFFNSFHVAFEKWWEEDYGRGYHLTNLLLHAAGAVALYYLITALLRAARGDGEGGLAAESSPRRETGLRLAAAESRNSCRRSPSWP